MLLKDSLPPPGMILALVGTYLASFGEGLCMGFPISSERPWKELFPNLSGTWFHLILPIGGVVGSMLNAISNPRLGRNKTIMFGACMAMLATGLLIAANECKASWALYLGVLSMGAACGVVSHTAPTYLHEVSNPENRGKTVSGHPAVVAVGLSLSLLIGSGVHRNVLTCLSVLPFVFSAIILAISPKSPLWLAEKNRPKEEVQYALTRLHGPTEFAENELQLLTARKVQIFSTSFRARSVNRPLAISMGLMILQQLTGFAGIIAILKNDNLPYKMIIAFSVTHIVMSIVAVFLHDTIGRKTLLYISSATELVGLLTLTGTWVSVKVNLLSEIQSFTGSIIGVAIFIGGYSIGAGPVPWVMMNELLPTRAKTFATTASTTTNWIFDTIVTQVFTLLYQGLGGSLTFFIFSIFVVVSFIFVYFFVPETSGLTIDQLEKKFREIYEKIFRNDNDSNSVVINNIEGEDGDVYPPPSNQDPPQESKS